jgi:hypothetical protein
MRLALLLLVVGTLGCETTCEGLSEADCSASSACSAIEGLPVLQDSLGEDCVDYDTPQEFAGCAQETGGCDDVMTPAADQGGDCTFYLPNSCLPDGWSFCEPWTDYEQCDS